MMVLPNIGPLSTAGPDEILRPVRPWFIVATLIAALALNLMPLSGVALALRPDFIALVLLTGASRSRVTSASASPGPSAS
jgi:hypothetical protein